MSRSPFDPHPEAPRTLRERLKRKFKRTVEPLAIHLLDWCRSLHVRVVNLEARADHNDARAEQLVSRAERIEARADGIEADCREAERQVRGLIDFLEGQVRSALNQVCVVDGQVRAAVEKMPALEAAAADGHSRIDEAFARFYELSQRTDQAEWGRQALVERLNADDARLTALVREIESLGKQLVESYWAREALVERLGDHGQAQEILREKLEAHVASVEDQLSLPLAFGLDALAMGRRIASLEDQVESLVCLLARDNPGLGATLVPFPPRREPEAEAEDDAEPEKAAG